MVFAISLFRSLLPSFFLHTQLLSSTCRCYMFTYSQVNSSNLLFARLCHLLLDLHHWFLCYHFKFLSIASSFFFLTKSIASYFSWIYQLLLLLYRYQLFLIHQRHLLLLLFKLSRIWFDLFINYSCRLFINYEWSWPWAV
jgi:hypothetical protein